MSLKKKKKISEATPRNLLHGNISTPGVFIGSKFVKKAGMTIKYENYNTAKRTDKQEWF